jgi:hypothetical protein
LKGNTFKIQTGLNTVEMLNIMTGLQVTESDPIWKTLKVSETIGEAELFAFSRL